MEMSVRVICDRRTAAKVKGKVHKMVGDGDTDKKSKKKKIHESKLKMVIGTSMDKIIKYIRGTAQEDL